MTFYHFLWNTLGVILRLPMIAIVYNTIYSNTRDKENPNKSPIAPILVTFVLVSLYDLGYYLSRLR